MNKNTKETKYSKKQHTNMSKSWPTKEIKNNIRKKMALDSISI